MFCTTLFPVANLCFHVVGYLCKQLRRRFPGCTTCTKCFSNEAYCSSISTLIDLKTRGGLIHANKHLFNLVSFIESCFVKNSKNSEVFDLTIDDVIENYNFSFPCEIHGAEVLSYAIFYYVRLRMKQFCYQENKKHTTKARMHKKLAKLSN